MDEGTPMQDILEWTNSSKFFPPPQCGDEDPMPTSTLRTASYESERPAIISTASSQDRLESLLLPDPTELGQERAVNRSEWRIQAQPRLENVCDAILHDNMHKISTFLTENPHYKNRGVAFPVKIESRAENLLSSRGMTLGHLLTLFVTPATLQFLETRQQLTPSMFKARCDLEVEYLSLDITLGQSSGGTSLRETFRSVPCAFMATFRDNNPTLVWLWHKRYLRRNANEVDSSGRNLLHCCVDEESPNILKEILSNRKLITNEILHDMLKTRDAVLEETPFIRACTKTDPVMMILFIETISHEFVTEDEDLSGVGKSVFNILFSKVVDSTIAIQVAKEFLKRGAFPDRHCLDDMPCIEALIANEHFSGPELKQAVKLLLKYNAKSSSGALMKLLRMRFRTDEELLDITRILIKNGGTRVLMSAQAFNLWQSAKDGPPKPGQQSQAGRDGQSVVVAIIKNKRISMSTMERLFNYISRYADIKAMFPDADGIALAISERMAYDPHQEQHLDLEGILRLLLQYACANRQDNDVRDFFDRLLRGLLRCIFERSDFSKAEKPYDKVLAYITHCLNTMEKMKLNFNTVVDGQVGLFSLFHPNVPDEVVIGTIESLPKSFNINIQSGMTENLASLTIKRFGEDFDTIYRVFLQLKSMGFDFKETVYKSETMLMVYVRKCGEMFDQLEEQDKLTAYIEEDFFKVMRFLFDEKIDMTHQAKDDEEKGITTRINVLTAAMRLKHCTIAEEIMKINPKLLNYVDVESVLLFIKNCPEVLEFFNGRSLLMHSAMQDSVKNLKDNDDEALPSRLQQRTLDINDCIMNVRSIWLNYVQHQHQMLLTFVGDEAERDYTKQVELIYDYLVHCKTDDDEDPEAPPSRFALEFSVFRRPELDLLPRTPEQAKKERINAPLFLKIVEKCSNVEEHPLFTEYFEKYYRSAFLNSLMFILYHILFIIFLNGSISHVVTETTHYALSSPLAMPRHYRCFMNNCTIEKLKPEQRQLVYYEGGKERSCPDVTSKCTQCMVHTANVSLCDQPSLSNSTLCPFKGHVYDPWVVPVQYFLLVMATVGLLRETVQLVMDPRDYMKNYIQNFTEIVMYLFVILFSINFSPCPNRAGFKFQWQFRLGVFAVLNSWFMMFFYTSKFPAFATYVIMFYSAVTSGLWLLITFSSLFFGFGFVFHLLLGNQLMFRNIMTSLNKVWIMLAGEIDYKDTMTSKFESTDDSQKVNYEYVTRFMLILFVLVISIVLTNLFIGLIVGDVEKINRIAETKKWKLNLEFIEYTDALSDFFRKWGERIRRCCGRKREEPPRVPKGDALAEERRCTQFLIENPRTDSLGNDDIEKAGLYAADLSWRNMFRWHVDLKQTQLAKEKWIAEFFGFVPRQELVKRLGALEKRKRRLRSKYDSRRSRDRHHNTVIHVDIPADPDDVEGVIVAKVMLPALSAAPRMDGDQSDPESEVTCHDLPMVRLKKLSKPLDYTEVAMDTSHSFSGASSPTEPVQFGHFLPRHDRKGQRRLLRPYSVDALNGEQLVGVGVQPPRHFFPSNAASPRTRSLSKPRRV